jgi:uncharacterized membrane protein (DUF106 family)
LNTALVLALGYAGLALISLCLWAVAAFLLKWRGAGRFVAAILLPVVFVILWMWAPTITTPGGLDEPGWVIFYFIVSVIIGAVCGLLILPVWYLAERHFRARFD